MVGDVVTNISPLFIYFLAVLLPVGFHQNVYKMLLAAVSIYGKENWMKVLKAKRVGYRI